MAGARQRQRLPEAEDSGAEHRDGTRVGGHAVCLSDVRTPHRSHVASARLNPQPQSPSAAPSRRASAAPSRCPSRRVTMWMPEFISEGTTRWPSGRSVKAERHRRPVELDLEAAALAAEVDEVCRLLRVEPPVEQRDERLDDIEDDAAAARRAEHGFDVALVVEDDGRRHGAARPLARRHGVGDGLARRVHRHEGKIRQLVVEQEAGRPVVRAEAALDGGGHRHGIAVAVDDRDVAGAGALDRRIDAERLPLEAGRLAGLRLVGGALRVDQRAALADIRVIEQAVGDGDEIRIADVLVAVGIGELLRLGDEVQGAGTQRGVGTFAEIERLDRASASARRSGRPTRADRRRTPHDHGTSTHSGARSFTV